MKLTDFFPAPVYMEPNILTTYVGTEPLIAIKFNIDLMVSQINSNEGLNSQIILVEENTDTTIPVNFVDYQNQTLTFTPSQPLNPGSSYQVTILSTIQSSQGRQARANRSFVFIVSQSEIPQTVLLEPANYTSTSTVGPFQWASVSVASTGGTGSLLYRVELDRTVAFQSISSVGWSTLTAASSAMPGVYLTPGQHYFWRVRAEYYTDTGSGAGEWSTPFVWYYGTFLQPSPSTEQTYPLAVPFQISGWIGGESGLSNQSSFPPIIISFSSPVDATTVNSSTVLVTRESVDGWPDSSRTVVTSSVSVSGSLMYINIGDGIVTNSRYVIWLNPPLADIYGNQLTAQWSAYFTSRYSPMYLGISVLRANFGRFLINVPDDILNFQIYRVSLDVNRNWILYYNPLIGGPTETQVRGQVFIVGYAMERWVEHESAVRVLTTRYYELLESVDQRRRLGDYEESQSSNLLKQLSDEIANQRKLATAWLAEFSRHRARVRTARKSSQWPVWQRSTDFSTQGMRRDNF
jgi:hypothetical protein